MVKPLKQEEVQSNEFVGFEEVVKPVIAWMNANCHPHTTIIVTHTYAEVLEGAKAFSTDEFFRD